VRAHLNPQDVAAAIVAVVAVCGLIVLAALGVEPPPALGVVIGSAVTWLFVRSAQIGGNGHA